MTILVAVVVALFAMEAVAWILSVVSARYLSIPTPNRRRFLAEQSAMVGRWISEPARRERLHATLGWEYRPGFESDTDHVNAQGLRATREYTLDPPPGVVRVAAFGDSYVYCNEVSDADTWPAVIERRWQAEVLNFGVGGYGPDQALLRLKAGAAQFMPRVVVLGITPMMIPRVVSRYRRFQDPRDGPWFKPRFVLNNEVLTAVRAPITSREDAERLLVIPGAVTEYGRDDYWYNRALFEHVLYPWSATYRLAACLWLGLRRRYFHPDRINRNGGLNMDSEALKITVRIGRECADVARSFGAELLILLLPGKEDVNAYTHHRRPSYERLHAHFAELGLRVVDVGRVLSSASIPVANLFAQGGHYSVRGNAIVAEAVAASLGLATRA